MPNLSVKARNITDPMMLVRRVAYRNERMRTRLFRHGSDADKLAFITILSGHNKSDLNRLGELLGEETA
jgi:hypothetical protein